MSKSELDSALHLDGAFVGKDHVAELLICLKTFHTILKVVDAILHSDELAVPGLIPNSPKSFPYLNDGRNGILYSSLLAKNSL